MAINHFLQIVINYVFSGNIAKGKARARGRARLSVFKTKNTMFWPEVA